MSMDFNFKPRLVVIFLQYDTRKYAGAFDHLKDYLGRLDQRRVTYILVNNKDEGDEFRNLDGNTIYVQGNNADWEFSGWQKGLEFIRRRNIPFDVVLFADDAFEATEPSYLRNHNIGWLILKCHLMKAVFGLMGTLWEGIQIYGKSNRVWLGTSAFFMPKVVVDKLGTMVTVDESSINIYLPEEFPGNGEIFKVSAPINQAYKDHIITWLTIRWHSKFVLGESSWLFFRAKTKAILNESLLSIRLRNLGHMIIPYDVPLFAFGKIRGAFRKARRYVLSHCQFNGTNKSISRKTQDGREMT